MKELHCSYSINISLLAQNMEQKGFDFFIIILMGTNQGHQDLYKQYMSSCFVPKGPYVSGLLLLKY